VIGAQPQFFELQELLEMLFRCGEAIQQEAFRSITAVDERSERASVLLTSVRHLPLAKSSQYFWDPALDCVYQGLSA
jgi:hypothetical protein